MKAAMANITEAPNIPLLSSACGSSPLPLPTRKIPTSEDIIPRVARSMGSVAASPNFPPKEGSLPAITTPMMPMAMEAIMEST